MFTFNRKLALERRSREFLSSFPNRIEDEHHRLNVPLYIIYDFNNFFVSLQGY